MTESTDVSADIQLQRAFEENARKRMNDPMVAEGERTESTLDLIQLEPLDPTQSVGGLTGISVTVQADDITDDGEFFDEAPGSFENDVVARLENIESMVSESIAGQEKTHGVIANIESLIQDGLGQIEPTIDMVRNSKIFQYMTGIKPDKKSVKP